jgi:hypothetical protein
MSFVLFRGKRSLLDGFSVIIGRDIRGCEGYALPGRTHASLRFPSSKLRSLKKIEANGNGSVRGGGVCHIALVALLSLPRRCLASVFLPSKS